MKKTNKRKLTDFEEQTVTGQLTPYSAENLLVNINAFQARLKQSIEDDQAVITADVIRQSLPVDKLHIRGQFELEEHCLDDPMRPLAESLEDKDCQLTWLKISYGNIAAYRIMLLANALKFNHSLTYLHIANNPGISRAGAHYIAEFLKTNRTLTMLNIRRAKIGDAGVTDIGKALEENPTLLELELARNDIASAGAKNLTSSLQKNHTLRWLSIEENADMKAKGAGYFAELLKITTSLAFLNLSSTGVRDAGAEAIAAAICANHKLPPFHLGFQINRITDKGILSLVSAIKSGRLIALDLAANENLTSAAMTMLREALQNNKHFRYINVGGGLIKKYTKSDIKELKTVSAQNGITFQQEEDDSASGITAALMWDRSGLENKDLVFSDFKLFVNHAELKQNHSAIHGLTFTNCTISETELAVFEKYLSQYAHLTVLKFCGQTRFTGRALSSLMAILAKSSIQELIFEKCQILQEDLLVVMNLAQLRIQSFRVDQPLLADDALTTLAASLKGNTTLTHLQLRLGRQCVQGFKNLIDRLKQHVALTTLSIKLCKKIHIQMLAQLLAVNNKISSLEILGYKPDVVDFTALGKVLTTKPTLPTLKLSDRFPFSMPHGGIIKLLAAVGSDFDPGTVLPAFHIDCTVQAVPAEGDAKQMLINHKFYPVTQLAIFWNMLDSAHLKRFLAHNHQLSVLRLYNCSSPAVINDVCGWLSLNNTRLQYLEYSLAAAPGLTKKHDFTLNQARWNFYNVGLVKKLMQLTDLSESIAETVRNYLSWESVFYSTVTFRMPGDHRCLFWSVGLGVLLTTQDKFSSEKLADSIKELFEIKSTEITQITQIATLLFQYRHGTPDFRNKFLRKSAQAYRIFLPMVTNLKKQMVNFIEKEFSKQQQAQVYLGADCHNMQEYKTKVSGNLWGGEAEICTLASMLKINIFITSKRSHNRYQSDEAKFTLNLEHVSLKKSASETPNHYNFVLTA
jgi:Ran GTPase-activating protein (RanGAP) involved in mRNA processing and transport